MLLFNILNELFRALPIISFFLSITLYLITKNLFILYIFIGIILCSIITYFLKNILFKFFKSFILYYNFNYIKRILGPFERPPNAKNCDNFYINQTNFSYTSGMPSGHSILAGYLSVFIYYYLVNKYKIKQENQKYIFMFSILFVFYTMYTRILFECHTLQQTIIGSIIGVILGHYYYMLSNKLINNTTK